MSVVIGLVALGLFAGYGGQYVLRGLKREVIVKPLWCATGVACLWGITGFRYILGGNSLAWLVILLLLGWFGTLLAIADFSCRRLPNALTLNMFPLLGGIMFLAGDNPDRLVRSCCAALLFFGVHLLVYWMAPNALGAGDVKLSASIGLVLGAVSWSALAMGALGASLITLLLAFLGPCRKTGIPHGPGMVLSTWLTTLLLGLG